MQYIRETRDKDSGSQAMMLALSQPLLTISISHAVVIWFQTSRLNERAVHDETPTYVCMIHVYVG